MNPSYGKLAIAAGLAILLVVLMVRIVSFAIEEHGLSSDLADIRARLTKAEADEATLKEETQYLADPVNLEKELRARFNYKKPGEKMIVIVPPAGSSTATSSDF